MDSLFGGIVTGIGYLIGKERGLGERDHTWREHDEIETSDKDDGETSDHENENDVEDNDDDGKDNDDENSIEPPNEESAEAPHRGSRSPPSSVSEQRPKNFHSQLPINSDTIRVLTLYLPVPGSEAIYCGISTRSLSEHYEAISYEWNGGISAIGSQRIMEAIQNGRVEGMCVPQEIFIDGHPVEVTWNLHAALCHIRKSTPSGHCRILWVDALCINQDDPDEKAREIPRMRDIYSHAKWVLVWLGESTEISDHAMDFFNRLFAGSKRDDPVEFRDLVLATYSSHNFAWQCFGDGFLKRSFWSRLWTVQEIALAPELLIMCGTKVMVWDVFVTLLVLSMTAGFSIFRPPLVLPHPTEPPGVKTGINPVISLRDLVQKGHCPDLRVLLAQFRSFNATLDHDRIYALLGVAYDGRDPSLAPSYRQDIEDVYIGLTKYMITRYRRLDFIGFQKELWRRDSKLPSWVPDIAVYDGGCEYVLSHTPNTNASFDACGKRLLTDRAISSLFSGSSLNVEGILVDEISRLGGVPVPKHGNGMEQYTLLPSYESRASEARAMAFGGEWTNMPSRHSDRYPFSKEETYWTACSRTLVYGLNWNGKRCTETQGFLDISDEAIPDDFGTNMPDETRKSGWRLQALEWKARFWNARRFMTSKKGYLGLVPMRAVVGDAICVLVGASEPMILRKGPDGTWKFVGLSYVHGIMDGEVMESHESKLSRFVLR